jgi:hypothetical protein
MSAKIFPETNLFIRKRIFYSNVNDDSFVVNEQLIGVFSERMGHQFIDSNFESVKKWGMQYLNRNEIGHQGIDPYMEAFNNFGELIRGYFSYKSCSDFDLMCMALIVKKVRVDNIDVVQDIEGFVDNAISGLNNRFFSASSSGFNSYQRSTLRIVFHPRRFSYKQVGNDEFMNGYILHFDRQRASTRFKLLEESPFLLYSRPFFRHIVSSMDILNKILIDGHVDDVFKEILKDWDYVESKELLARCGLLFEFLPGPLRTDDDLLMAAIQNNAAAYRYANEIQKEDPAIVRQLVLQGRLDLLPMQFRNDLESARISIHKNPKSIVYAGEDVRSNAELVLYSLRHSDLSDMTFISGGLFDDESFVRNLMLLRPECFAGLDERYEHLRSNFELCRSVLMKDGNVLQHMGKTVRNDPEMVLAAVENNVSAIRHAGEGLLTDMENVRLLCRRFPAIYRYLPVEKRNDIVLAKIAINDSPCAYEYIPDRLSRIMHLKSGNHLKGQ